MTLNKKCLSWLQSVSKRLVIEMLSHKKNYISKKSKQDMLCINTREDDDGHVAVEASIPSAEKTDVMELVEPVTNLVAAEDKIMCETFVNKAMSRNVTMEMTGKPPMNLAECLEVANIVCAKKTDQMGDLHRKSIRTACIGPAETRMWK